MRTLIIYVITAILLNVSVLAAGGLFYKVKNIVKESIVITSLPVSKGLNEIQRLINEYLVLISVQKENEHLRKQLTKCMLECKNKDKNDSNIQEASFSFKGNFDSTTIYLRTAKELNIKKNYCFVLEDNMHLVGIVKERIKNHIYKAYTVFNPSFVADVKIVGDDNQTFRALYMGNEYSPKVEFLDPNVEVKEGDSVYTTGEMGIFPPNLFIGTVKRVKSVNGYYKVAFVDIKRSFFNKWKVLIVCRKK
ncbi:rod shape-determining protein MreC [Hippea alviniae]|uniref:rod shape-determining protein MreC n=1 Tax=Hippea alviniae TaxID=1279027 RepID=UPI0003B4E03F|nr:rod shape-determining protein MreC [Hippea alviniae]